MPNSVVSNTQGVFKSTKRVFQRNALVSLKHKKLCQFFCVRVLMAACGKSWLGERLQKLLNRLCYFFDAQSAIVGLKAELVWAKELQRLRIGLGAKKELDASGCELGG